MREGRRENNEDRPEEAARGPQMRPPEGGANPFLHHAATCSASSRDRRQREKIKEKREETREKRRSCLSFVIIHDGDARVSPGR